MNIPQRVLRCINLIEKHGFRFERLEKELYEWLELKKINPEKLDTELDILLHDHSGTQLIKKLEKE